MAVAERRGTSRSDLLKRIFVGRPMASGRMEHTLLPKFLALPIFASDALSSVAYSVEASLLILIQSSGNVRSLIIPINVAVAAVIDGASARIALTGVGAKPVRAEAAERAFTGSNAAEAAEHAAEGLNPPADTSASSDYRKHLVRVLTRRALEAAAGS